MFQSSKTALQLCKTTAKKDKKRVARANLFFANQKKIVLLMQFVFLLIRSIDLDAIFICPPRLALHDLIFWLFASIINQSFAFSPG